MTHCLRGSGLCPCTFRAIAARAWPKGRTKEARGPGGGRYWTPAPVTHPYPSAYKPNTADELPRIHLPRTWVNKGRIGAEALLGTPASLSRSLSPSSARSRSARFGRQPSRYQPGPSQRKCQRCPYLPKRRCSWCSEPAFRQGSGWLPCCRRYSFLP
jgi:hypothetical protein